jgi:hypothetical protein
MITTAPLQPREAPIPNQFSVDFPNATEAQKGHVAEILKLFIRKFRTQLGALPGCAPEGTCASCAFDPSIDNHWAFRDTAYGLLYSILNGKHFLCHSNQPSWKEGGGIDLSRARHCAGFKTACSKEQRDATVRLAIATQLRIERVLVPAGGSIRDRIMAAG